MLHIESPISSGETVSATIRGADFATQAVTFSSSVLPLTPVADAWLAATLPVAMRHGRDVRSDAPVSQRLLAGVVRWQQVLAAWYPDLRPVRVEAPATARDACGSGVACFFSGGVDSWASILRHRNALRGVIGVHGFDVAFEDEAAWHAIGPRLAAAAGAVGLDYWPVATNLRSWIDRAGDWGQVTHGAGLASVALLLQNTVRTVIVPSSHTYSDLFPWGSHPILDPLWSTEAVTVVHDGAELTRVEKTALISSEPAALAHLRVCWRDVAAFNCGVCEKCLRTRTTFAVLGVPPRTTPSFADTAVTPAQLRNIWLADENSAAFAREIITSAPSGHPLAAALSESVWRYEVRAVAMRAAAVLRAATVGRVVRWLMGRMVRR